MRRNTGSLALCKNFRHIPNSRPHSSLPTSLPEKGGQVALGAQRIVRTAPFHARRGKMSWRALRAIPFDRMVTSQDAKLFTRFEGEVVRRICLGRLLIWRASQTPGVVGIQRRGGMG